MDIPTGGQFSILNQTHNGTHSLESYRFLVGEELLEEIYSLALQLKGLRVAHINATANGGGVAEILRSTIPMYQALGIDASWLVMEGNESFFNVTKHIHNALQGAERYLNASEWDSYLAGNRSNVSALCSGYDVVFVHDPQPAAIRQFAPAGTAQRWVWRCHIDTSTPNRETWQSVSALVNEYDAAVFSIPEFVGPGLRIPRVAVIPPAIDPLTPKNRPMAHKRAARIVRGYGVDPERPFITQVSRFDPWKDPLGVIAAFQELRKRHKSLQLVLLGNLAYMTWPSGSCMPSYWRPRVTCRTCTSSRA